MNKQRNLDDSLLLQSHSILQHKINRYKTGLTPLKTNFANKIFGSTKKK